MVESPNREKLTLEIDNTTLVVPCLKFVLYLDTTDDVGILDFYKHCMNALDGYITHYKSGNMKFRGQINSRSATIVPTWFGRPREDKPLYHIEFSGCEENQGISPATIEMSIYRRPLVKLSPEQLAKRKTNFKIFYEQQGGKLRPPASALRVTLPLDHALAELPKLFSWISELKLVKEFPFLSGHCGYALNHYEATGSNTMREEMQSRIGSLCLRYPGLDWHNIGGVLDQLLHYDSEWNDKTGYFLPLIKRVNWLTFISSSAVNYLGGENKLRQDLGTDLPIFLHTFKYGFCIQAGEAPQLGDIGHRDFLPVYRRVAKVLRPVRLEAIRGLGRGFSHESANEWLNAFDKDYD